MSHLCPGSRVRYTFSPWIAVSDFPEGADSLNTLQSLWEHASERMFLYSLARFLSASAPLFLQAVVMKWAGSHEAAEFYLFSSSALLLSFVADFGGATSFPVLFGSRPGQEALSLGGVLQLRRLAAIAGGLLLTVGGLLGLFSLSLSPSLFLAIGYIVARTDLCSLQGFLFARRQFGLLLGGACGHAVGCLTALFVAASCHNVSAEAGLVSMLAGIVIEWITLRRWSGDSFSEALGASLPSNPEATEPISDPAAIRPDSHPEPRQAGLEHAFWKMIPFALAGLSGALYSRSDAFIGSWFLSSHELGIYGTLDALSTLMATPSRLSAMAAYPDLNAAREREDGIAYARIIRSHLIISGIISLTLAGFCWAWVSSADLPAATRAAAWYFLLALPLACPNSLVVPHFFPRGLERVFVAVALSLALLRPLFAGIAIQRWGMPGLAAVALFLDLLQAAIFWGFLPLRHPRWFEMPATQRQ